ncbi:ESX secretion-associated protein EspG [Saccharothrix australiensis]|uniref:ESAT-6 protein secretion system EspG family protein n=1 Tax=Saccharothrix australiensis TaxID=2072 RepID=A0A495W3K0_9PSEU|nr:ESX secretion-associated protein EspG [Saccharothrix australiensis]RKT55670.1 ESAT-6 protein secretion system EspG family protein [Saccharothrix australiensis]
MLRAPVVLSDTEFDVLWHHDDLGEHHTVLHVPPADANTLEVENALHREGVRVDEALEALRVLAFADFECFGWIAYDREVTLPVVVATAGRHGVFALRDNGHVRIDALHGDPSVALAACLPEVPPGRGSSINARAEEAQGSRALVELMQRPRTGVAKLFAAKRDRYGRRRRSTSFVTTLDCPDGRWLVVRYVDNRGQAWVHATPAGRPIIAQWLHRLGD